MVYRGTRTSKWHNCGRLRHCRTLVPSAAPLRNTLRILLGKEVLRGDVETAVGLNVAVCHARRIECCTGEAVTVEQNQTAGGVRTMSEFADARICYGLRDGKRSAFFAVGREDSLVMQKIGSHFGHHNFHDSFAVACAGYA